METSLHLISKCRYTRRIWGRVATWVVLPDLSPPNWKPSSNTLEWWINVTTIPATPRKAVRTLVMLVIWEIWKEINMRIFQHKESSALSLLAKIKNEAAAWAQAGATHLASLIAYQ